MNKGKIRSDRGEQTIRRRKWIASELLRRCTRCSRPTIFLNVEIEADVLPYAREHGYHHCTYLRCDLPRVC